MTLPDMIVMMAMTAISSTSVNPRAGRRYLFSSFSALPRFLASFNALRCGKEADLPRLYPDFMIGCGFCAVTVALGAAFFAGCVLGFAAVTAAFLERAADSSLEMFFFSAAISATSRSFSCRNFE
jgi:hypothetical protein